MGGWIFPGVLSIFSMLSTLSPAVAWGKGLMVSPSNVYAVVPAGGELSREIVLTPSDSSDTKVTASVDSFTLGLDGEPERGTNGPRTAALTIAPSSFLLRSGRPETLTVRYVVDKAARGSFWAVILLDVEPVRQTDEDGKPLAVVTRLAVPVFVTVDGAAHSDLRITDVKSTSVGGERIELEATLENEGDSVAKVSGFWVLEAGGATDRVELASSDVKDVLVLPGTRRRVRCVIAEARAAARAESGELLLRYGTAAGQTASARFALKASPAQPQPQAQP